jgi:hypothetical protein
MLMDQGHELGPHEDLGDGEVDVMSGSVPRDGDGVVFDPDAVHAKYLAERDKRLVPGRAAIRDLSDDDHFARYRRDPFTPVIEREPVVEELDVVIVGGGIAGVATAAHLR